MCGRYTQTVDLSRLIARFHFKEPKFALPPRYNIAPSQEAPVLIQKEARALELLRWGLIPSWAKDPSIGHKLINARAETLAEKPSFKRALQRSRCLVLADGFYEWTGEKNRPRMPLRAALKSREPFAFAGLWESWRDPTGQELKTFTIVTTAANEVLRPIYDRMPAILRPENEDAWLDPKAGPDKLLPLLAPYPAAEMEAYPVSPLVNSPKNESPELIAPSAG